MTSDVRETPSPAKRWRWPILLFILTVACTSLAQGPLYAATLMSILVAHEMGHFMTARAMGVPASPPYFIPFPPLLWLPGLGWVHFFGLGTLGAVIRMDGHKARRRQLLAIGAAGPIAGFVVAVPAMILGLVLSEPGSLEDAEGVIYFGSSLLSTGLESWLSPPLGPGEELIAHPIYIAAWAGFLVTALNLLPMGQLDGGHVVHAARPGRSGALARGLQKVLIGLGILGVFVHGAGAIDLRLAHELAFLRSWISPGLLVWAVLAGWLGVEHPPGPAEDEPLRTSDWALVGACGVILLACFMPSPIYSLPPPMP